MFKKVHTFIPLLTVFGLFFATHVYAADFTVSPLLIELEMMPRDSVTKPILVTNQTDHILRVFATVNEVALGTTGEIKEFVTPSMTDESSTVTSWTSIKRSDIFIPPHSSSSIPLTIQINPAAKPGTYTEFIGFVSAEDRPTAEAVAMRGGASGVMMKVTVGKKTNQLMRISGFFASKFIFKDSQRSMQVEVENRGDTEAAPMGEIIFYNSRGEEVASAKVNEARMTVAPGKAQTFDVAVPFLDKLGRFKANVRLDYGEGEHKTAIFDTTMFFMVPLSVLIAVGVVIVVLSLLLTYLLSRAFYNETHDDSDDNLPLYIRSDREHETKDHDIHIQKN